MMTHRMPRGKAFVLTLLFSLWAGLYSPAPAQISLPGGVPTPLLLQISPSGCKAGDTVEVVVTGRNLEEIEKLVFSRAGIKAEEIGKTEVVKAPNPDPKSKAKKPKGMNAQQPAESFRFKVTVPANTSLGMCDVRVVNKWGVSNTRVFQIGDLKEVAESEPNNEDDKAQRIDLNTTVNGGFAGPQDVDYYVVKVAKGQRVIVSCLATSVDSRANPAVEIYDKNDRQLASNNNYSLNDAVTDFVAPQDGDYLVRVLQFAHTFRQPINGGLPPGMTDHFYRLSVTTAPWIDSVHPCVVEPGKATKVIVYGRNLPGGKVDPNAVSDDGTLESVSMTVNAPADGSGKLTFSGTVFPAAAWLDGFELRVKNAAGSSNPYLIGLASLPLTLENSKHDSAETAQAVTVPCEIAGRVEKRRDRDWYSFEAKRGDTFVISVSSARLGAPTYMKIAMRQGNSKNDMFESPLIENTQNYPRKFYSRSEDPLAYRFTAPADGKYLLLVSSRAGDTLFGPRHTYSVKIKREQPNFRLVAMDNDDYFPRGAVVPVGGSGGLSVLIDREDGFAGDVELSVEGLPSGVSCPTQILNGSLSKARIAMTAAPGTAEWAGEIRIKGTAMLNGNKVVREARVGGIVWPGQQGQDTPTLSRLESSLWMAVRGKSPFTITGTPSKTEFGQGENGTIKLKVNRQWPDLKNPILVGVLPGQNNQLRGELPQNLRINNFQPVNVAKDEASLNVNIGQDVPPGVYNIVLHGQTQTPFAKDPMSKTKTNALVTTVSESFKLTVLPKALAIVQLTNNNPTVKVGGQVDLMVRIQRRFNYNGEFKVQVVLPNGVAGVEIPEVSIPENQSEAKLVVKAPGDSKPGFRGNLTLKATALFGANKLPIVHETKFNVNVVK